MLTPLQSRIVALMREQRMGREELAQELDVSETLVARALRRLCKRFGAASLEELTSKVRREE